MPSRVPRVVSPLASLRVYEPLAAFPPSERTRWERYAASGSSPGRLDGARRERALSLAAVVAPTLDVAAEQAFLMTVDGLLLVCPWQTQVRVWEAAREFREGMHERVADAFLPRALADHAEAELERWRAARPDLHTHVRVSPWHVPVSWFVAFDAGERVLVVGDTDARSLTYATAMSAGRRRVGRALSVLRRTIPDAPTVAGLEDLGRWLEEFHPHSRVELDYGGLADLVDDDWLRADTSVADIAASVSALGDGDGQRAFAGYERVVERWRPLQAREQAS